MQEHDVNVAIIGAGTAGLSAYQAARECTDDVVLIEGGPGGTTCARVGCMPSKLLIAAAEAAATVRNSEIFGINVTEARTDGRRVMRRLHSERDRFVESVYDYVNEIPSEARLQGMARFESPCLLRVGEQHRVNAKRIVIATGSHPVVPDQLSNAGARLLLSKDLFELDDLPESVAVFGAGPMGLELGQALHRLGVHVAIFGKGGSLGGIASETLRDYAQRCFSDSFYLDTDAQVHRIAEHNGRVSIQYEHRDEGSVTQQFDYLLSATGRAPNLDGLDLHNTGLRLDERGLPQTDPTTLQCGSSHIFMVGDVNGISPVLHEASQEGRIAGRNAALYPDINAVERMVALSIVFSDPQIVSIGEIAKFESACHENRYAVGSASFEDQGRSRVLARNRGLLRVYGERDTGVFKGAEMFGPAAEHIAHLLAWAAQQQMTVAQMLAMPFYHPVIEEGLRTALKDLRQQLGGRSAPAHGCSENGPGA